MVQALGYVTETFDPASPGRLCRGRERWIEYETMEPAGEEESDIQRIVLSGASFSDDRARDAKRGLGFGPVSLTTLLHTLLGEGPLIAYCEEGHPHQVPEQAAGVEHHTVARPGGSLREWRVRWHTQVDTAESLHAAIDAGADVFIQLSEAHADPASTVHESPLIPPVADEESSLTSFFNESLAQALFFLTGFRAPGRPNRYFQPWGIPAVLEHVSAVALLHRDKHGPALGVYSKLSFDMGAVLTRFSEGTDSPLLVPFAIPPMLARWDRALWELRQHWDTETYGDFPVPAAPKSEQEPPADAPAEQAKPEVVAEETIQPEENATTEE